MCNRLNQHLHREDEREESFTLVHDVVELGNVRFVVIREVIFEILVLIIEHAEAERVHNDQENNETVEPGPFINPDGKLTNFAVEAKFVERVVRVAVHFPSMADEVALLWEVVQEVASDHPVSLVLIIAD